MRINLTTTYPEREKAKALGARWDAIKRVWYIIDPPDLTPFLRWLPCAASGSPVVASVKPKPKQLRPRITGPGQFTHCGCDVLPWDDCVHTVGKSIENNQIKSTT